MGDGVTDGGGREGVTRCGGQRENRRNETLDSEFIHMVLGLGPHVRHWSGSGRFTGVNIIFSRP